MIPTDWFLLLGTGLFTIGVIGVLTRRAGEPLCGAAGAAQDCPPGLFAPAVSCPACLAIAAREGVTVAGAA